MDHVWISELQDGQLVDGVYFLRNKNRGTTKSGKPYLSLVLGDRTGELEGKVWDNAEQFDGKASAGDFVFVQARGNTFANRLQLVITYLERVEKAEIDSALFLPVCPGDIDSYWREVATMVDSLVDQNLRDLCKAALADDKIAEGLRRAPAATGVHQAYVGGLLEHTCSMMLLADKLCNHYPTLDRSLLLAGVLFHDLGKIDEMSYELSLDYTDEGKLVGHQTIAIQMVSRLAAGIEGLSAEKITLLHHLILSHHGKPEYGAARVPMFAEAAVLHHIDNIDAKVFAFLEAEAEASGAWSDRKWFLENTSVFKLPRAQRGYRFNLRDEKAAKSKKKPEAATDEDLPLFEQ